MPTNDSFSGVSNCYVFKSRLQEYAQKAGLPTPVYETIKEGPSHQPSFRSAVILNDVRYDSLPGFFNRKAAEQSAAEVALMELAKSGEVNPSVSQPVHETGLCKNLLQEYAQKMNYAIPLYQSQRDEAPGRAPLFKCNVEIGGIQYIGASARTKKEAEIKAARTALLAIQSNAENSDVPTGNTQLTVIPCRKRGADTTSVPEETTNVPKAKKGRFKKKMFQKKFSKGKVDRVQGELAGNLDVTMNGQSDQTDASAVQGSGNRLMTKEAMEHDEGIVTDSVKNDTPDVKDDLTAHIASSDGNGCAAAADFDDSNCGTEGGISVKSTEDATKVSGVDEVGSMDNNSIIAQTGVSSVPLGHEAIEAGASQV